MYATNATSKGFTSAVNIITVVTDIVIFQFIIAINFIAIVFFVVVFAFFFDEFIFVKQFVDRTIVVFANTVDIVKFCQHDFAVVRFTVVRIVAIFGVFFVQQFKQFNSTRIPAD